MTLEALSAVASSISLTLVVEQIEVERSVDAKTSNSRMTLPSGSAVLVASVLATEQTVKNRQVEADVQAQVENGRVFAPIDKV